MKPEDIKLKEYYLYPASNIIVNAWAIKDGVIQLYPINSTHDIGAGKGNPIPATEQNTENLVSYPIK